MALTMMKGQCYVTKDGSKCYCGSDDIHIPGSHNIENILTVIALTYVLGVPEKLFIVLLVGSMVLNID